MTDEELCKALKLLAFLHNDGAMTQAADRIEQLQQALKEQSSVSDRLAEANEKMKEKFLVVMAERDEAWERAEHAEEQWGRCGVKLAKAVEAAVDAGASLAAAISLLERGGRKAAPSNKMFDQMLVDYRNSLERTRTTLAEIEGEKG